MAETSALDRVFRKLPLNAKARENLLYGFEVSRTILFTGQMMSLPVVEFLSRGKTEATSIDFKQHFEGAFQDLLKLLRNDAHNIQLGYYPVDVLEPENPLKFWTRYPRILLDGYRISRRRDDKSHHDFDAKSESYFGDVPEYYRRNFHFQTDGYLSDHSADLYEHQVEILFSGAADPMRRLVLKPLKEHFGDSDGTGLHFLEVGAGTGRLTHFLKLAFPQAKITALDLSEPYLVKARHKLEGRRGVQFMQGDAADLPFKNETFDAVVSCFMFHELPREEREKVLAEAARVLKPGGFGGHIDSIQLGDAPDLDWGLKQFPVKFHEPFYPNYVQTPLAPMVEASGLVGVETERGFFSKVIFGTKPA